MEITLYPLADYNEGKLNPFTIDLDNLTEDEYRQEIARGLFEHSAGGNVESTRCAECGHVAIGQTLDTCPECGASSDDLEHRTTNEEWIVCDYEDIPKRFVGEYDLDSDFWEYAEFMQKTDLSAEVVEAGLKLGIELDHIEEAYWGHFDSDEDFAQEMAESIGAVNRDVSWPYTCIDWEQAARELMYDYCEENGYYFCNV